MSEASGTVIHLTIDPSCAEPLVNCIVKEPDQDPVGTTVRLTEKSKNPQVDFVRALICIESYRKKGIPLPADLEEASIEEETAEAPSGPLTWEVTCATRPAATAYRTEDTTIRSSQTFVTVSGWLKPDEGR